VKIFSIGAVALVALGVIVPVHAKDMRVSAKRVDPPLTQNWSGFYVGANAGYSWGRSGTDLSLSNTATGALLASGSNSFDLDGAIAGLQIGYNHQNGNWIWGVEADWQWSGQKGDTSFTCLNTVCAAGATAFVIATAPNVTQTLNQNLEWFSTLRGRIGGTLTPTTFAYVTGGLAVGQVKSDGTLTSYVNAVPPANILSTPFSSTTTTAGWVVGLGVETVVTERWTAKIEYLYMDLGHVDVAATSSVATVAPPQVSAAFRSHITDNILRVGVNYRF
jgi:outer membrane immunogenic protein